jgi:hypothetical protein
MASMMSKRMSNHLPFTRMRTVRKRMSNLFPSMMKHKKYQHCSQLNKPPDHR